MQADALREIEWASPKATTLLLLTPEPVPEEYGTFQWAAPYAGRFGGDVFSEATKTGPCAVQQGPACGSRKSVKKMPSRERATYVAFRTDCQKCSLREQCLASKAKGDRARRVSAVRRLLPQPSSVERRPVVLGPMRLSWMWQGVHFDAPGQPDFRRQYVEVLPLPQVLSERKPPRPARAVRSRHRWRGPDRLACNTGFGPPQVCINVAGVPAFLVSN